jgi:hypothetical protein
MYVCMMYLCIYGVFHFLAEQRGMVHVCMYDVCMYVCLYVCMSVCVCVLSWLNKEVWSMYDVCMYVCMYVCHCMAEQSGMVMYVCMYGRMCAYVSICMRHFLADLHSKFYVTYKVCMYVCMQMYVCVCMHACMRTHGLNCLCMYVHMD